MINHHTSGIPCKRLDVASLVADGVALRTGRTEGVKVKKNEVGLAVQCYIAAYTTSANQLWYYLLLAWRVSLRPQISYPQISDLFYAI